MSILEIKETNPVLEIVTGDSSLEVAAVVPILELLAVGAQGTPGIAAGTYEHIQSVASNIWTVNHNLGRKPASVTVRSEGGVEVEAAIVHISDNQLQVQFVIPFAGVALVQ